MKIKRQRQAKSGHRWLASIPSRKVSARGCSQQIQNLDGLDMILLSKMAGLKGLKKGVLANEAKF
jgi:hypothetical protein